VGIDAEAAGGVYCRYRPSTFLTHVRASIVPISSLALLTCKITGATGVSPRAAGAYRYFDSTARKSLGFLAVSGARVL
jgi:hypothetical protein